MHLKTLRLTLKSDRPVEENAAKLRGFFATRFTEYALLHQHIDVDKLLYRYPRIQYKILEGDAIVLGIEEGAEVLKEIYDKYDEIILGESAYTIVERGILIKEAEFGISPEILSYEFITPWIALSQHNYQRYLKSKREARKGAFTKNVDWEYLIGIERAGLCGSGRYKAWNRTVATAEVRA
jgi:hypothetical protein